MDGKLRRLPVSISLQDFRTVSAPPDLEASADLFEAPRGAGYLSRAPKGSLTLGSLLNKGQLQGSRLAYRVTAGALLIALVLVLFYLGFLWGRNLWNQEEQMHFAIVVDCGSTSTRVYVYGWVYNGRSIPVMYRPPSHNNDNVRLNDKSKQKKAYHRMETEPGFHHLLHNETGLRAAVQPLLDWAKQQIPMRSHGETPLFLLGTAGLRKMATADSEWLLDKAWSIIEKSPFKCRRSWLRVITGVEEAYYGWVALNYIVERLGHDVAKMKLTTVGSLDLGGSSLEVTFEPDESIRPEYSVNLSIGRDEHHLYAYSHSGFGLNDAFDKSVAVLMHKGENLTVKNGTLEVRHPCLHNEYRQPYSCSSYCVVPPAIDGGGTADGAVQMELVGVPHWKKCQALARSVINTTRFSQSYKRLDCEQPNCALGKYQPQPRGQFYALAGFFVMYKFFGLSSKASLDDLLQRGQQFCEKPWPIAKDSVEPQDFIDRYCFRAPYVVALLREGLHLKDEQITVGPGDITWTQGAALLEAGVLIQRSSHKQQWFGSPSSVPIVLDGPILSLLLLLLVLLLILAVSCYRRRSYAALMPFDAKSSTGNGTSRWLPFVRNVRSGDGRGVKLPHSPAPSGPKNSFQEPQGLRMSTLESNVPLLLEGDVLRLPPSGPGPGRTQHHTSGKMQPKGGSRLQSRRTPSKEDLNSIL